MFMSTSVLSATSSRELCAIASEICCLVSSFDFLLPSSVASWSLMASFPVSLNFPDSSFCGAQVTECSASFAACCPMTKVQRTMMKVRPCWIHIAVAPKYDWTPYSLIGKGGTVMAINSSTIPRYWLGSIGLTLPTAVHWVVSSIHQHGTEGC